MDVGGTHHLSTRPVQKVFFFFVYTTTSGATWENPLTNSTVHRADLGTIIPATLATMESRDFVDVAPDGDVVLEVTFDTSKETLKTAKRAVLPRLGQTKTEPSPPMLKARIRKRYRVQLNVLKQHSRYFNHLLSDARFSEGRSIETAFQQLSLKGVTPAEADPNDLPMVKIHEDDEASKSVGQDTAFEDLMRILHRKPTVTKPVTMHYLAMIAVLADRFDCTALVSKWLNVSKYKWQDTKARAPGSKDDGPALTEASEDTLRQRILVSWLLDQPLRLQATTRELIMYGSRRWAASEEEGEENVPTAAWWDLPQGLEGEQPSSAHHPHPQMIDPV